MPSRAVDEPGPGLGAGRVPASTRPLSGQRCVAVKPGRIRPPPETRQAVDRFRWPRESVEFGARWQCTTRPPILSNSSSATSSDLGPCTNAPRIRPSPLLPWTRLRSPRAAWTSPRGHGPIPFPGPGGSRPDSSRSCRPPAAAWSFDRRTMIPMSCAEADGSRFPLRSNLRLAVPDPRSPRRLSGLSSGPDDLDTLQGHSTRPAGWAGGVARPRIETPRSDCAARSRYAKDMAVA